MENPQNGQGNCLKILFWAKSLIKFFGSGVLDMGRSRYWKRQYFLLGLTNTSRK